MLRFISASSVLMLELKPTAVTGSRLNKPCLECLRLLSSHANRGHTRHRWHAHTKAGHTWHLLAGQWTNRRAMSFVSRDWYESSTAVLNSKSWFAMSCLGDILQESFCCPRCIRIQPKQFESTLIAWSERSFQMSDSRREYSRNMFERSHVFPAKQLKFHPAISCLYLEGHHHHRPDQSYRSNAAVHPPQLQQPTSSSSPALARSWSSKIARSRALPSLSKSALQINVYNGHSWTKLLLIHRKERISPKFWWLVLTTCLSSKLL